MEIPVPSIKLYQWLLLTFFLQLSILPISSKAIPSLDAYGQVLDTKVTVDFKEEDLKVALDKIENKTKVHFSYKTKMIKRHKAINLSARNQKLSVVLNALLQPLFIDYKLIGEKNIVLKEAKSVEKIGIKNMADYQVIEGFVTDENDNPLIGATVKVIGTSQGSVTDINGKFAVDISNFPASLEISFVGYETQLFTVDGPDKAIKIALSPSASMLDQIVVVGSRSLKRSATDTPVALDVIDVEELVTTSGQVEINQLLQYAAPSFNANKQSGSDGADHIDPATLRGLGPDQTLVLINGKRRHGSSLINIFGSRGRGNSGTDLNAIPIAAIKRIEVLRDGASAQYGSDAIAGVINIVLKDNADGFTGGLSLGAHNTNADGSFPSGTPNTDGNRINGEEDQRFDGGAVKFSANYGLPIGKDGFANVTFEYLNKNKTLRPGYDFRRGFGEAGIEGFNTFIHVSVPVTDNGKFYVFGGRNYRNTDAFAFTRNNPTARNVVAIYPDGFTPRITSIITDNSISAGFKSTTANGWTVDINNTFGANNFHYLIKNTLNASLEEASPTSFDAGGHQLQQNTTGLDFSRYFDELLNGVNFAFGLEYRSENFQIFAGEEGSYGTFDVDGRLVTNPAQVIPIDPITGDPRPGGSQGFPGYSPANEVDRSRSTIAFYGDGEFDISDKFLVSTAGRFEHYSDFGSTFNVKLATRYRLSDDLSIRGAISTGFRAPSLAQIFYNLRFTDFQGGVASETLLSPNNSPVTRSFGIQDLEEERATNASLGFTFNQGAFSATIDGYLIHVDDRIVLTGNFDASNLGINVVEAQFFANGVDTRTTGLDIVLSWKEQFGQHKLSASLAGNINDMEIKAVKNGNLDRDTFFGEREEAFLLASAPDHKFRLNLGYGIQKIKANLAFTKFSEIRLIDFANSVDLYESRVVTDLNIGIDLLSELKLTLGINNLFNVYPTAQEDGETETGGYWDAVQMGFAGSNYFARLGFKF